MSAQPYPEPGAFGTSDPALSATSHQGIVTANAFIAPTKQELEAIVLLKDQDAAIVCAYLRVARALGGGSHFGNGQSVLTDDKVRAIFALSGHEDAIIWTWLSDAQSTIDHNHSESLSSRVNVAHDSLHKANEPYTSTHLSADVSGLPAHETTNIPPPDSKIIERYPSNEPVPSHVANVSRPYSCTICGSQRSYQNHYDWKKHEKEHEANYICMHGSSQDTLRIVNENTQTHGSCKFTCKRRDLMVSHLNKKHEIHKVAQARILADQWRRTTGKRFWSCGFCIRLFTSFAERLKHIGRDHYERSQTYHEWDTTKLIRGLLLQPEVQRAWESILATGCTHHSQELVWDARGIEETQHLLEMGPSPTQSAESLAMAAYEAGKLMTEPPQPAPALSITPAIDDVVETNFGNSNVTINPPVSRHASVEHMLTHPASDNTSVVSTSIPYWAASTGQTFDELCYDVRPSDDQVYTPDGTPGSYYDGSGLASVFEYSNAT